jgi:SAM-dependent methyltransferase
VRRLLDEFAWNPWFTQTYWPENEPRVRLITRLAAQELPEAIARRTLEVGCASGYVAVLCALLGCDVVAVDADDDDRRSALFRRCGIAYRRTNLNDANPLSEFDAGAFHLVLLGEVFEHILNRPAGLLERIHQLLRPGGVVILTTPNPSTLANAVRLLRDRYLPWGTAEFLRTTKLDRDKVIDRGDIHYREYPAWVVGDLLVELGFEILGTRYVRSGSAPTQSLTKRGLKNVLRLAGLSGARLFAPGYVIWARKPAN